MTSPEAMPADHRQGSPPASPNAALVDTESQWLFADAELQQPPSVRDGMSVDEERLARRKAINFVQKVGMALSLPQTTLYTAAIFLHRYLMRASLVTSSKAGPRALHRYVRLGSAAPPPLSLPNGCVCALTRAAAGGRGHGRLRGDQGRGDVAQAARRGRGVRARRA